MTVRQGNNLGYVKTLVISDQCSRSANWSFASFFPLKLIDWNQSCCIYWKWHFEWFIIITWHERWLDNDVSASHSSFFVTPSRSLGSAKGEDDKKWTDYRQEVWYKIWEESYQQLSPATNRGKTFSSVPSVCLIFKIKQ